MKTGKYIALILILINSNIVIFSIDLFNKFLPDSSQSPFGYCNCLNPIGGGSGYKSIIKKGSRSLKFYSKLNAVQMADSFETIIKEALEYDTIFLDPRCIIQPKNPIEITKPIVIASNRGDTGSLGALITCPIIGKLFIIKSNNIRISGLRLVGNTEVSRYPYLYQDGIFCKDERNIIQNFEIDNCEISHFTRAIEINPDVLNFHLSNFLIHNNYIHDNRYFYTSLREDLGYGVMVGNAYIKIFANLFFNNRHDVAGQGFSHSGYDAYCNTFLGGSSKETNLDMHAFNIYIGKDNFKSDTAGGYIHIHHNIFKAINPQSNIYPAGKPSVLCLVDNNIFKTSEPFGKAGTGPAVAQNMYRQKSNSSNIYGNIVAINNIYNDNYLGWYVKEEWDSTSLYNVFRIPSSNDILLCLYNAEILGSWINLNSQKLAYSFGDFTGSGRTEIFKADIIKKRWYYIILDEGYKSQWTELKDIHGIPLSSDYPIGTMTLDPITKIYEYKPILLFGNFDFSSGTDIFMADGKWWNLSYDAKTAWNHWIRCNAPIQNVLFGKFKPSSLNHHNLDVFLPENNEWRILINGNNWITTTPDKKLPMKNLLVGDFNGDGYSDIFYSDGKKWEYSSDANAPFKILQHIKSDSKHLFIVDFNSDKISDVLVFDKNGWKISLGGVSKLFDLDLKDFPLSNFNYGNLKDSSCDDLSK